MGFVGLTVADIAINAGDLTQVLLRLIIIFAAVTFFIVTAITKVGLVLPLAILLYTSFHAFPRHPQTMASSDIAP